MFSGLMSRWITPSWCAYFSASAASRVMRIASSTGSCRSRRSRSRSVSPRYLDRAVLRRREDPDQIPWQALHRAIDTHSRFRHENPKCQEAPRSGLRRSVE
jgi:hypothetical protein